MLDDHYQILAKCHDAVRKKGAKCSTAGYFFIQYRSPVGKLAGEALVGELDDLSKEALDIG